MPLLYTHRLRNLVNSSASPIQTDEVKRFDGPVLASGVKVSVSGHGCRLWLSVRVLMLLICSAVSPRTRRLLDPLSAL